MRNTTEKDVSYPATWTLLGYSPSSLFTGSLPVDPPTH